MYNISKRSMLSFNLQNFYGIQLEYNTFRFIGFTKEFDETLSNQLFSKKYIIRSSNSQKSGMAVKPEEF